MNFFKKRKLENNLMLVCLYLLTGLKIKATYYNIAKLLSIFPIKNNIEAIGYALREYNIDSMIVSIDYDQLINMRLNTFLFIKDVKAQYFSILFNANTESIVYYAPHLGIVEEKKDDFLKKWDGISVILDHNNHLLKERYYQKNVVLNLLSKCRSLLILGLGVLLYGAWLINHPNASWNWAIYFFAFLQLKVFVLMLLYRYVNSWSSLSLFRLNSKYEAIKSTNESSFIFISCCYLMTFLYTIFLKKITFLLSIIYPTSIFIILLLLASAILLVVIKEFKKVTTLWLLILIDQIYSSLSCINSELPNQTFFNALNFLIVPAVTLSILLYLIKSNINKSKTNKNNLDANLEHSQRAILLDKLIHKVDFSETNDQEIGLLTLVKQEGPSIRLFLSPYDLKSGQIFLSVVNYLKSKEKYNLIICFVGSERDALYCQFTDFVISIYRSTPVEAFFKNLTWWYSQYNKNFDQLKTRFPAKYRNYEALFIYWNTWAKENGINSPQIIIDDQIIPSAFEINDLLISLDLLMERYCRDNMTID